MALFKGSKKTKLFMVTLLIITMIAAYGMPLSVYAAEVTNDRDPTIAEQTEGTGDLKPPEQPQSADQTGESGESDQPGQEESAAEELTTYVVEYETAEGTKLLPDKVVEEQTIGAEVVENAVEVDNYTVDKTSKSLTLAEDANSITFIYTLKEAPEEVTSAIEEEEEDAKIAYDNPDNLTDFSSEITQALEFNYPLKRFAKSFSLMSSSSELELQESGAINLTKQAEPVVGTDNQWKVTLKIEGKNILSTSDVVLVIDKSGSLSGSKMTNTKATAKEFVDQLLKADGVTRIAVVTFDQNYHLVADFTDYQGKDNLKTLIDGISADGGTNIQSGIHYAQKMLNTSTASNQVMVLLGDGEPTYSHLVTGVTGITITGHDNSKAQISYDNPTITEINYGSIVGSGGDYALGEKAYRYRIPCSEHVNGHSTTFPENNGIPTIYEAGLADLAGTDIYSIALDAGDTGESILRKCQNSGYYEVGTDLSVLSDVFSDIAGEIAYAASEGIVVDPMGNMFDLRSKVTEIQVSQGTAAISEDNRTITWNVGNIAEGNPATMSYIVQIKAGAEADEQYPTNLTTTFTYTDAYDNKVDKNFEVPEVSIGGGSTETAYKVEHYKQDANAATYTKAETEALSGTAATTATAIVKSYDGYTYDAAVAGTIVSGTIAGDGSLVLKLYYKKNYTVSYEAGANGDLSGTAIFTKFYGESYPAAPATVADRGYHFDRWSPALPDAETTVTGDATYTANFAENDELSITDYSGVYDSDWHSIAVGDVAEGSTVYYSLTQNGEDWSTTLPTFRNVTVTEGAIVYVKVTNPDYADRTGNGTVKITERRINITADSASKTYDGTPLTANSWKLTYGTVATGEAITSVTVTGSQITVGSCKNIATKAAIMTEVEIPDDEVLTATLVEYEEVDATSNYIITYVEGTLTVTSSGGGGGGGSHNATVAKLNKEDHFAYIQGYPDATVRPQGNVTREEVAAVFYRLLDSTYRDKIRSTSENFSDIEDSRWSLKHIGTLSKGQIITGYPDGSFRPGEYITRAELAAIAARFDDLSVPDENKFTDITGHWAEDYILSAEQKGWVRGYPDGTFRPDQYITRAEFVTLVNNVLNRKVEVGEILPDAKKFSDLEESKWYYLYMEEAINSHNYERKTNGSENWTEITSPNIEM